MKIDIRIYSSLRPWTHQKTLSYECCIAYGLHRRDFRSSRWAGFVLQHAQPCSSMQLQPNEKAAWSTYRAGCGSRFKPLYNCGTVRLLIIIGQSIITSWNIKRGHLVHRVVGNWVWMLRTLMFAPKLPRHVHTTKSSLHVYCWAFGVNSWLLCSRIQRSLQTSHSCSSLVD